MPMSCRAGLCMVGSIVFAMISGCGSSIGQATGTITIDQQPVAGAEIGFELQEDPKLQAFGSSAASGSYTINYPDGRGMPVGKYTVMITRYTLPNGNPLPPGEKGAALRAEEGKVTSKTYYFEVELHEGANVINFELRDGKSIKPGG